MKKFYFLIFLSCLLHVSSFAQTLIPVGNELVLPQYAYFGGTVAARSQVLVRLTLTGLTASTIYRYSVGLSSSSTTPKNNAGTADGYAPGTLFAIRNNTLNIEGIASNKGLNGSVLQGNISSTTSTNYYGAFLSDANGEFTGWFATASTGNATQQISGSNVYFYVQLGSDSAPAFPPSLSFRTTSTIKLLDFGTVTGNITPIVGTSTVGDEKMVLLYDNTAMTGRPLYATWTENDALSQDAPFSGWYATNVGSTTGKWGGIIPNNLSTGVRGIKFVNIDGSDITIGNGTGNTSADGVWNSVTTVNPNGGDASPIVINSIAPSTLPITLTNFSADVKETGTKLNWTTASEVNNQYFEVLSAGDDKNFSSIGRVKGAVNSTESKFYSFSDFNPIKGNNYYQLKQFDLDGKSETFGPVAVKFGLSDDSFKVLSSSESSVMVSISSSVVKQAEISYIGLDGRVLYKQKISLTSGLNTFSIPVDKSAGRIGIINFRSDGEQKSLKIAR